MPDSQVFTTLGQAIGAIAYVLSNRAPRHASVSFTRPANTTVYAKGDVVGSDTSTLFTLSNICGIGQHTLLTNADLMVGGLTMPLPNSTIPSPDGLFEGSLFLFNSQPTTTFKDNDPFTPSAADMALKIGTINFLMSIAKSVSTFTLYELIRNKNIWTNPTSSDIYGIFVTSKAWTPSNNSGTFSLTLDFLPLDLREF